MICISKLTMITFCYFFLKLFSVLISASVHFNENCLNLQVTNDFLRNEAIVIVEKLLKKDFDNNDFHGGPYVGGAGIAYALFRAGKVLDYKKDEVNAKGEYFLNRHLSSKVSCSYG